MKFKTTMKLNRLLAGACHPRQTVRLFHVAGGPRDLRKLIPGDIDKETGVWIPRMEESISIAASDLPDFFVAMDRFNARLQQETVDAAAA